MISEFVVKLMKDCLSLATEYDLNYLVHNASVYLWNYAQKLRKSGNMTHIPMMFLQAFDCLTVKNDLATNLIVQMGTVLANSPLVTKHEEARSSIASDTSGKCYKSYSIGMKLKNRVRIKRDNCFRQECLRGSDDADRVKF